MATEQTNQQLREEELFDEVAHDVDVQAGLAAPTAGDVLPELDEVPDVVVESNAEVRETIDLKPFEDKRYEQIKQQYDPLQRYLRETVGIDPSKYNLSYRTVKELKFNKQRPDEVASCIPVHFTNYSDLLKYRQSLSEANRAEFDSYSWSDAGGRNSWSGAAVFADEKFWSDLHDEKGQLHEHEPAIKELMGRLEAGQETDLFAQAVASGEVKVEQPSTVWRRIASLKEKLPGLKRKSSKKKVAEAGSAKQEEVPTPETKGADKAKRVSGDVAAQLAYDVGWRTVGTAFGVKFLGDVALAVTMKKGDVYEATRGKQVKAERKSAESAVKEFFYEYRRGGYDRFHEKVKALDTQIREAKYLSPQDRKLYRDQVAATVRKYRREKTGAEGKRDAQIKKAADLYFQKKVSTVRIVGDALNTAFTFGGLPVMRGVGYGATALAERGRKASLQFERDKLKQQSVKEKRGQPANKAGKSLGRKAFIAKDVILNSTLETLRDASFVFNKQSSSRKRDVVLAFGSLARLAGLAGIAASELGDHSVSEGVGKLLEAYKHNGGSQVLDNFKVSFGRTIDGYRMLVTHPTDIPERIWHGLTRSQERGNVPTQSGSVKVTEIGGGGKVTIPEAHGSGAQKEILDQAQEFAQLTKKLGLTPEGVARQAGPGMKHAVEYMRDLDRAMETITSRGGKFDASITQLTPEQAHDLVQQLEPDYGRTGSGVQETPSSEVEPTSGEAPAIDQPNPPLAPTVEQHAVAAPIEVEISGKVNTISEAMDKALHSAPVGTQEAFIHKLLGADKSISDDNRLELLQRAVAKFSVSNLGQEFGKGIDVENLVYKGNKLVLEADGSWEMVKGEGPAAPRAVAELELNNAAGKVVWQEDRSGSQGVVYYHELDNSELPPDSSALGHELKEVLVDYAAHGTSPDGVAEYVELRDSDGSVVEVLSLGEQKDAAAAAAEAHRLAMEFDKGVGQVEAAMPASSKDLSLAEKSQALRWAGSAPEGGVAVPSHEELLRLGKLDGQVAELKGQGFGRIDFGLVEQYQSGKLGWHVSERGEFVWDKAASRLTGKHIELPIARGSSFTTESMNDLKAVANAYLTEHEQTFARVHQVARGNTEQVLAMRCSDANDEALSRVTHNNVFGMFKGDKGVQLYEYFKRAIGPDYLSDTEHTLGERLAEAAHRNAGVEPPSGGTGSSETESATATQVSAETTTLASKAAIETTALKNESAGLDTARTGSSRAVIEEVKGEIQQSQKAGAEGNAGAAEHADDVFGEMDKAIHAYDMLHNPGASAAEKMSALKDMKLTDGGRPYMFKGNSEGIGLKDGKFIYYHLGKTLELTYENIDSVAKGNK